MNISFEWAFLLIASFSPKKGAVPEWRNIFPWNLLSRQPV